MNPNRFDAFSVIAGMIGAALVTYAWGVGALGVVILLFVLEDTISEDYAPFRKGRGPRNITLSGDTNVHIHHHEE